MDRVFSLAEANRLIPRLEECLTAVRRGKADLVRTKDEIRKASSKAALGGGSFVGAHYVRALEQISRRLRIPLSRIYGVVSFYARFYTSPRGRHTILACRGTACHLKGSGQICEMIRDDFNVEAGGTTADGLFSFQPVNCVGACALAPVMIVDEQYHDGVSVESARKIIHGLPAEEAAAEAEAPS